MRVWDLPVTCLCNKHLLAQHNEIHAIYSIIINKKNGFSNHPEVNRWRKHIPALFLIHTTTAVEMVKRGYKHNSRLFISDGIKYPEQWQTKKEQIDILKQKSHKIIACDCYDKIMGDNKQGGGNA